MDTIDLDELIEKKRKMVFTSKSLDLASQSITENKTDQFLMLIIEEAAHLKSEGTVKYKMPLSYRLHLAKNRLKQSLRTIDDKLQQFKLYKLVFRRGMRRIYRIANPGRTVNISYMYKLSETDFIEELYRVFLNREPDAEGLSANLKLLQNKKIDRLELIYIFNRSNEIGYIPTVLRGKWLLRLMKKFRR